ncbi:MAG: glycosyltransferase [Erysipelotrichaceae bacterium]|nr:glycosyltransferase [Erysipelotrichaceae bacterium]
MDKIGNVVLDYTDYIGKDLYSDGDVEDELLDIVKNNPTGDYSKIISEKNEWPFIYHLSSDRGNVLEWIPISKNESVLEIGSGCGAITGTLAKKAGHVTCVELSKKRSLINAYRNRDYDNVEIKVGNFETVEKRLSDKYDVITLIGVFEYAGYYINSSNPYEDFLTIIKKHLKPNGRIIIAIENKFGLKYWAGCKEDHVSKFFEGIEGYTTTDGVKTFSNDELAEIMGKSGFKAWEFYYPYPDYKLPYFIFSKDRMPREGELTKNINNYDQDRMCLFDEAAVFDEVIKNNRFDFFSNSYVVVLSENDLYTEDYPLYVKYNIRDNDKNLKTSIIKKDSALAVEKTPMFKEAEAHIESIKNAYNKLSSVYSETNIALNRFDEANDSLYFEYVDGTPLDIILDEEYSKNGYQGFLKLIKKYIELIKGKDNLVDFVETSDFNNVFGQVSFDSSIEALKVANIDACFANIIVNGDTWNLIDYEWTFDFPIPLNYIIYRSLELYISHTAKRHVLYAENIYEDLGIDSNQIKQFRKMDKAFYAYALGNNHSFSDALKERVDAKSTFDEIINNSKVCIYFDFGNGFSEEKTKRVKRDIVKNACLIRIKIPEGVSKLRVDPVETACVLSNIEARDEEGNIVSYSVNGIKINDERWYLPHDPQIILDCNNISSEIILTFGLMVNDNLAKCVSESLICSEYIRSLNGMLSARKQKYIRFRNSTKSTAKKFYNVLKMLKHRNMTCAKDCLIGRGAFNKALMFNPLRLEKSEIDYQKAKGFKNNYKYAIILPISDGENNCYLDTLLSIVNQTYGNFHVFVFMNKECKNDIVDNRISYFCADNFFEAFKHTFADIDADYIAFVKSGDRLSLAALWTINYYLNENCAEALYVDDKKFELSVADDNEFAFKPDFAIDTLKSSNYIGDFGLFSKKLLTQVGGISSEYPNSYVYDLFFKASILTDVKHVSKELYFSRKRFASVFDEELEVVNANLVNLGVHGKYTKTALEGVYKPEIAIDTNKMISILIPNKDNIDILDKCIKSIKSLTSYPNYEIVIVENNSVEQTTFEYYESLKNDSVITVVRWPGGWNYAAINNFAVKHCKGDYIVLLNNDIEIISANWLGEMLMFAQRSDVGAVGAKLFYPDGTIQHVGVTVGVRGVAGHAFHCHDGKSKGYMNRAVSVQNLSAVTAACMMMRREVFESIGGFNEAYEVAFNDVDLCLRIIQRGYKIVFTPYAELLHYESKTRGDDSDSAEKTARFGREVHRFNVDWRDFLYKGDPFYNKNLSLDNDDFTIVENRWEL